MVCRRSGCGRCDAGRHLGRLPGLAAAVIAVVALIAAVLVAVHLAEVIALRVGEPFGALVLALAVTVIEATLIVAMMLSGGAAASALARDTVFAAVMIICNGVVGLCLVTGSMRHRELSFRPEGTTPALAVPTTLTTLTLVLPAYTSHHAGPTLSSPQLVFAGVVSLVLYAIVVFVQTVRHRQYFLPENFDTEAGMSRRPRRRSHSQASHCSSCRSSLSSVLPKCFRRA